MSDKIRLTEAELDILGVLWERHGATVKDVCEVLGEKRQTSYTTFLKLMQIMFDKKLVQREQKTRAHVYYAALDRLELGKQMLTETLEKIYGNSAIEMVTQILQLESVSPKDKKKIQKLIKRERRTDKTTSATAEKSSPKTSKPKKNKKIVLKEVE